MERQKKSAEQIEAERMEVERLRGVLLGMTDKCPDAVLGGSHQKAVQWKQAAIDGRRLAESKNPTIGKLQNAVTRLQPYYSAA